MGFFDILISLIVLVILEIILGIDNLIFLSILTQKLPTHYRRKARRLGLMVAWISRLVLLFFAIWIVHLQKPIFHFLDWSVSPRDLFLLLGGVFLIAKATEEIHGEVANEKFAPKTLAGGNSVQFFRVVLQIGMLDIIFSFDSILTAVGLTEHFWVMASAITIAIAVMIYAAEFVTEIIRKYPTIKMLALSFLILIGMVLIADGFSFHIPRGYVYFAMGFSLSVETLNLYKRSKQRRK